MSRSDYSDDCGGDWQAIMWRGAVHSAITGRRGQAFLIEMRDALDEMPEKRLVAEELTVGGDVCAMGAVARKRAIDMAEMDPENYDGVACKLGIASALAREIAYMNDDGVGYRNKETPEQRWRRMREWVDQKIIVLKSSAKEHAND